MSYIPDEKTLTAIKKYCKDKPGITLTVGVLDGEETKILAYGPDGEELKENTADKLYEIGSVTKTFTAALMSKLVFDKKVEFKSSIAPYIGLGEGCGYYPTLERLATHTSGLGRAPVKTSKLVFRAMKEKTRVLNMYDGFNGKVMEKHLRALRLEPTDYPAQYSHFGMGALGYVLGKIDGRGYKTAIESFVKEELGLADTHYGMPEGRCDGGYSAKKEKFPCWVWEDDNAMAGSDCLTSTAADMLKYAEVCMSGEKPWLSLCFEPRAEFDDSDSFGYGFIIREDDGIVWHNGATGCFTSFWGFDAENHRAVVVLSDYEHVRDDGRLVDKIGFRILKRPASDNTEEYRDEDTEE